MSTPQSLEERFRDRVAALAPPAARRPPDAPVRDGTTLTGAQALALFDAQLTGRHLDLAARWLRSFGEGYHAVASAGHEGDAAVAAALRVTDPALLDARCGAFYCARAAQAPGAADPLTGAARDVLRGVVAAAAGPGAGGRQKVFGDPALAVVPTASPAGGHLPRAVGIAFALGRAAGPGATAPRPAGAAAGPWPAGAVTGPWPADAVAVAVLDAEAADRAEAAAALAAAGRYAHAGVPLPLLVVCADDGPAAGPPGWAAASLRARPGLRYHRADGADPAGAYAAAAAAVADVRAQRRPAVLHLATARLLGPGAPGTGAPEAPADPLAATAELLVAAGLATPDELLARYDETGWRVRTLAEQVLDEPKLATAAEVAAPLAPRRPVRVARAVAEAADRAAGPAARARAEAFGGRPPEQRGPLTLAQTITATLTDALVTDPRTLLFGADAAGRGGRYGVTAGLSERLGGDRVFDTPPDEATVLGLALGAGLAGLLPVPELAYPAALHRAGDQLRGEAAMLQLLSAGGYRNPLVVRFGGLAYQGAEGSPAEDDAVAGLREVPGLVLAVPARPADAAGMLRSCLAAAAVDGSVCAYLEPAALYHTRDLHEPGDGGWLADYPAPRGWAAAHVPIGRAGTYRVPAEPDGSPDDLTVVTFGNGVRMSLRVAARLARQGYGCRVVDLRWLNPLPVADLLREASATGRVLVVDETRRSGGVGEGVLAALVDGGFVGAARRVAAADTPVPPGPAAREVLVSEDAVTQGAHALLAR